MFSSLKQVQGRYILMLHYKIDILDALKRIGFTTYKIRKDKIIGEAQMQKIRTGEIASKETLNTICRLLDCQPGDIMEYIPDEPNETQTKKE